MDSSNVVPSLLQEGSQEVEGHDDVLSELFISHEFVTGSNVKVGDLFKLPLDGTSDIINLLGKWFSVGNWLRELTNSGQNWTEDDWDLLNESIGGEKKEVLLSPSLDEFLIFVEFLQGIKGSNLNIKFVGSGLILMLLIGNKTDLHLWSWDVWESDSSDETLVFLWIVILKGDLEFNSLLELSLFGVFSHLRDALKNVGVGDL